MSSVSFFAAKPCLSLSRHVDLVLGDHSSSVRGSNLAMTHFHAVSILYHTATALSPRLLANPTNKTNDSPHEFTTTKDDQQVCSNANDNLLVGRDGTLSGNPGNMLESRFWESDT
jgi:hypothetical protein